MSVHLGRYLDKNEHVDHINEDKSDDRIENLQILIPSENDRKSCIKACYLRILCYNFGLEFYRKKKHTKNVKRHRCSTTCIKNNIKNYGIQEEIKIHISIIEDEFQRIGCNTLVKK